MEVHAVDLSFLFGLTPSGDRTGCGVQLLAIKEIRMRFGNRLALSSGLAVSILLVACSSTPVALPVATPVSSAPSSSLATPQRTVPVPIAAAPIAPYLDPQSRLYQKRSIYFDFDQSEIKPVYAPLMELHGKYLASHPNLAIKIEGNTDEQGGAEYNLALGQKRAESVAKAFKIYGVKDSQMEAISFGKEKPKVSGHDEASHAENRRVDLAYPEK